MTDMPKAVAIIQARTGSNRLPGKVLEEIAGKPMIEHVIRRVRMAKNLDEVWVATTDSPIDDLLVELLGKMQVPVFRGSEDDVLSRFSAVARKTGASVIVRVTADCPLIDPDVIDEVIEDYYGGGADYVSNAIDRTFPDGLDIEVFSREALERADVEADHPILREHVTLYIHGNWRDKLPWGEFTTRTHNHSADFSHLRWCVDEPKDLKFMNAIMSQLPEDFRWLDVVALLSKLPDLVRINRQITVQGIDRDLANLSGSNIRLDFPRSEAALKRALKTIPLGSQTFSKSHQQYVLGAMPQILKQGIGCRVVDADGYSYIDHVLGLLPIVLGYQDPDVDTAILAQLEKGITFSLPCEREADLAEMLVRLIPSAEKVRFGKNGSDATSAAIRISRAYTGREKVAICGYHGWHDWYIGATSRHLGVPQAVRNLSVSFGYNQADQLADLLRAEPDAYAAVILEPTGAAEPQGDFLKELRSLTERYGVLLVFDEIITGFRINLGGAQSEYGITPDLSCFGKAMGNGMPISAIVGRADIMDVMQDIFFSGTFSGEALSLAAAIATIDKLERENAVARMRARGRRLMDQGNGLLEKHGLADILEISGADWWPRWKTRNLPVDVNFFNSLLRQETAAAGLLVLATFNLCLAHDNDRITAETMIALDQAFAAVRDALNSNDPASKLRGEPIQPTFSVRPA